MQLPFLSVLCPVSQRLQINNRTTDGICSMSARETQAEFCPAQPWPACVLIRHFLFYFSMQEGLYFSLGLFFFFLLFFAQYSSPRLKETDIFFTTVADPFPSRFHKTGTLNKWIHETLCKSTVHLIHTDGSRSSQWGGLMGLFLTLTYNPGLQK